MITYKAAQLIALAVMAIAAADASAAATKAKRANHNSRPKLFETSKPVSSTSFRVENWASLNTQDSTQPANESRLNIDMVSDNIEEITVYGERIKYNDRQLSDNTSTILVGPVSVTGTTHLDQANFLGMKVTAAIPIVGVPGLDAVMNVSGGYDQVNASTTASSAAATVGLRLKF